MILRGPRVLITGGAGLIGSHVADALAAAGVAEIVVLDNFSRGRTENLTRARARGRVSVILPVEHEEERTVNTVRRRLADTSWARARLGFESRVRLEEGLRCLVAWWRSEVVRPAPEAPMPGAVQS